MLLGLLDLYNDDKGGAELATGLEEMQLRQLERELDNSRDELRVTINLISELNGIVRLFNEVDGAVRETNSCIRDVNSHYVEAVGMDGVDNAVVFQNAFRSLPVDEDTDGLLEARVQCRRSLEEAENNERQLRVRINSLENQIEALRRTIRGV